MLPVIRIAFRNVLLQRKRSLLIGFAVMLSALLLLLADVIMNGVDRQVVKGYVYLQAGHVTVLWEDMKDVDSMDSARFMYKLATFDPAKKGANGRALDRLAEFVQLHHDQIALFDPTVRQFTQLRVGQQTGKFMLYGLTEQSRRLMTDARAIAVSEGELPVSGGRSVAVSRATADEFNLKLGDTITVETVTVEGKKTAVDLRLAGIYANGAGYDNIYGFMPDADVREILGYEKGYFDAARIYLKEMDQADAFARELNDYLAADGSVLYAQSYEEASAFYTNTPKNLKFFSNLFVLFLLFIIAIGLRSTIGISLFQRMREFGTIRAIGFSKLQNYMVILLELLFLSLMALGVAFVVAAGFTAIFSKSGVYVGPGAISYPLGGESFYPEMKATDVIRTILVILLFALLSTLGPGMRMCNQNITDLLMNRMRKVSALRVIWNVILPGRRKIPA